jgi:cytochrome c-type biogenesis protein
VDFTFQTLFLLPAGLGLLGFVEPCTIGGHLVFLESQNHRSRFEKYSAVMVFVMTRSIVAGLFGGIIALAGQRLIGIQTGLWLVFGLIYLGIGLAFAFGRGGFVKLRLELAPSAWKRARHPLILGLGFGLNIPACAAPILFGLLGLAATTGTVAAGFAMMFLFGLFLSLPLVIFAAIPSLAEWLSRLGQKIQQMHGLIGVIFILLGLWSIWFGLYVNPANWAGT